MSEYPSGLDVEWLAVDREGRVGCLRIADVSGAVAALAKIGAALRPGSPLTIDDPDGHRLELHPLVAPSATNDAE